MLVGDVGSTNPTSVSTSISSFGEICVEGFDRARRLLAAPRVWRAAILTALRLPQCVRGLGLAAGRGRPLTLEPLAPARQSVEDQPVEFQVQLV